MTPLHVSSLFVVSRDAMCKADPERLAAASNVVSLGDAVRADLSTRFDLPKLGRPTVRVSDGPLRSWACGTATAVLCLSGGGVLTFPDGGSAALAPSQLSAFAGALTAAEGDGRFVVFAYEPAPAETPGRLLSVFTPSHDPRWLADAWASLKAQTHADWEWVVLANGPNVDVVAKFVADLVRGDRRVRVEKAGRDCVGIGALKRAACELCRGDVLVEFDHDDLLTPDCLQEVADAAKRCPASAFIFSDDATVSFDGKSTVFTPELGWRSYEWKCDGWTYKINAGFPVTPRSLCEILYAPDHVRAWTREAYRSSGGHDPKLHVGDDHDLVVRTYLCGAHFEHVGRPLYLHRVGGQSASVQKVKAISEVSAATRDRHLHALVAEWCRRERLPMLDLGGAHNSPPGFVPVDREFLPADGATYKKIRYDGVWPERLGGNVFDALDPLPDSSVGCVRAFDFLEHLPPSDVVPLMNLVYDKLVPGGYFLTHTPAVCDDEGRCGRAAYQDPDHNSFWSSNNFWYWTDKSFAKYTNGAVRCRFQTVRVANRYPSDWHRLHLMPYVSWDGMALKDDERNHYPGPKLI